MKVKAEHIKWFTPQNKSKKVPVSPLPTLCITANEDGLICHYFDNEAEALRVMPFIKNWARETFREGKISYHSKQAYSYWDQRNDKIHGVYITHNNGSRSYKYY